MHILCLKLLAFSFTNATWVIEWVNEVSYSHIAFRMMKKLLEIQSNHSDWNAFATKSKQSQTNQMLSLTFLTDSWSCTAKPHFLAENQCETLSSCATHTWRIVIGWIRMQFVEWLVKVCDEYFSLQALPQKVFFMQECLSFAMRKKDEHSINTDCSVFSFWFDLSFIDYLFRWNPAKWFHDGLIDDGVCGMCL